MDLLYIVGLLVYIIGQLIIKGNVQDYLFIVLLSVATVFVNFRQQNLYDFLVCEDAERVFKSINIDCSIQNEQFFMKKGNVAFSVMFAAIFSVVIFSFKVWQKDEVLNILFSLYLFTANIPTGLAIIRIFKYFKKNVEWISNLNFGVEFGKNEVFIKKICIKVLFTAVIYSAVSLSSVLFTAIELNYIVLIYTIFAILLIAVTVLITNTMIYRKIFEERYKYIEKIEIIEKKVIDSMNNASEVHESLSMLKDLEDVRAIISKKRREIDWSKIGSGLGLLIITVIPIVLQWILEKI